MPVKQDEIEAMLMSVSNTNEKELLLFHEQRTTREKLSRAMISQNMVLMQETLVDLKQQHARYDGCSLEESKGRLLILNTALKYEARSAGLSYVYLDVIFEQYVTSVTNATSKTYLLNECIEEMVQAYFNMICHIATASYATQITNIINYISTHITEDLSLQAIAAVFDVNKSFLSRKFKEETGTNFSDYVNEQRIALAQLYLKRGNSSVMEVSQMVGYDDSNYFSKVFKQVVGTTPRAYMKQV